MFFKILILFLFYGSKAEAFVLFSNKLIRICVTSKVEHLPTCHSCLVSLVVSVHSTTSLGTSGQDGGIGKTPSLPRTTKRRMTTNLKSINNQKRQKIKLHGTPTTKELKKKKQTEQPDR